MALGFRPRLVYGRKYTESGTVVKLIFRNPQLFAETGELSGASSA